MDVATKREYKPSEEYEEDCREPLIDISVDDSTELWLIQWPYKQNPDFDGKELSLELHGNGKLGGFEDASGKVYDVLSFDSQEPGATVFLSSASESKIVGKISRQVSLVHYPEPQELEQLNSSRKMYPTAREATLSNSSHRFSSSLQSSWRKNSQSTRTHSSYTHSSRHKSSFSEAGEPSKPPKRRRTNESNRSTDHSTQDTGGERRSGVTFSGSSEHSHQTKIREEKKI